MAENKMYMTYKWFDKLGAYLAVISMGSPQVGDKNVTILDSDKFPSIQACNEWYERMKIERPWETRN